MKNLVLTGALMALMFSACNEVGDSASTTDNEKVEKVAACDANNAESATKCLCGLLDQSDNADALSDDEYNALQTKIDELNNLIDRAIEDGKYTEDDLFNEAAKIDCTF